MPGANTRHRIQFFTLFTEGWAPLANRTPWQASLKADNTCKKIEATGKAFRRLGPDYMLRTLGQDLTAVPFLYFINKFTI